MLKVDESRCVDCRTCMLACSFYFEKSFQPSKSRIRISMDNDARISIGFNQCSCNEEKPPCVRLCPRGVISINEVKEGDCHLE